MVKSQKADRDNEEMPWRVNTRLDTYMAADSTAPSLTRAESRAQLYRHDGADFVILAFRTFLRRDPTATELGNFTGKLMTGVGKGDIAAALRYGDEARNHSQDLHLKREQVLRFLDSLPVLGKLIHFFQALAGLPGIKRGLLSQQQELSAIKCQLRGLCHDIIYNHDQLGNELREEVQSLRGRAALLEEEVTRLQPAAEGNGTTSATLDDDFYLAFEAHFRGSEEEIRQRLQYYLPLIGEHLPGALASAPMADIGCGRGEWLDLLSTAGYTATGVDLNQRNIDACRARGLNADRDDGIGWLQNRESRSLGLISSFHVIEHLALPQLLSFLVEALRCLKPGGMLILETPNPENLITAAHRFYTDPSHRNPVPPDFIEFLLRYTGFAGVAIHRLHPPPASDALPAEDPVSTQLNGLLYGPQDYAAIAFKP